MFTTLLILSTLITLILLIWRDPANLGNRKEKS